ncbi:MAG TPA: hypothetical protein VFB37_14005 [Steroidobacteraceae bacterium]|nr:hypothetical protein [Steroidobacteraceae bacterium]
MVTIVDLHQAEELSCSDMAKVAGGGLDLTIPVVVGIGLYGLISSVAGAGLDGAKAANGVSDPETPFPGQSGTLQNLRSP